MYFYYHSQFFCFLAKTIPSKQRELTPTKYQQLHVSLTDSKLYRQGSLQRNDAVTQVVGRLSTTAAIIRQRKLIYYYQRLNLSLRFNVVTVHGQLHRLQLACRNQYKPVLIDNVRVTKHPNCYTYTITHTFTCQHQFIMKIPKQL